MSGSSVDREIRITASDTGVFDRLNKLKESALSMGRGIAEDAKKQATSSRELIKLMNDEIALIEKRNKLNKESREINVRDKFSGGTPEDKKSLSQQLQQISVESKEDKIQSDLLKQILQSIVKTSQEEVTANREGVKKSIASDKEIDTMEDHEEALKQTFQKQMLEDTEEDEDGTPEGKRKTSSRLSRMGGFIKETDMYTMGYSGASDLMNARADNVQNKLSKRLLLMGGFIAGGLGTTIAAASEFMEGQGDVTRASGLTRKEAEDRYDASFKGLDISDAAAMRRTAQLNLAAGTTLSGSDAGNLLKIERGTGLDATKLASLERFSNIGGLSTAGMTRTIAKDRGMGLEKTNEILEGIHSISQQQFMATGQGNTIMNAAILNRIMTGQHGQRSATRAAATAGRLDSMIQSGDEQLEAVKFSEFQKAGGGDYFDYLLEKEKGIAGSIDDIVVDKILASPGTERDKLYSLVGAGMSPTDAQEIIKAGGVSPLMTEGGSDRIVEEGYAAVDAGTDSERGLNLILQSSAAVSDGFAAVGQAAVELADKLIGAASATPKEMEDRTNAYKANVVHGGGAPASPR